MISRISHRQGGAHFVDPNRLNTEQRTKLAATMSTRLNPKKVEAFLQLVSDEVDTWENLKTVGVTEKHIGIELERIIAAAKRISSALSRMDKRTFDHFAISFDTLLWVSDPQRQMPWPMRRDKPDCRQWLNDQLEALHALETAAEYAAGELPPDIDAYDNRRRRGLVRSIAWNYQQIFDKRPPQSTWFYTFMSELGDEIGVVLGRDIVAGVLSDLKKNG